MARNTKRKAKKKGKIIILVAIILGVIVGVGVPSYISSCYKAFNTADDTTQLVVIPSGSGTETIGNILEESGIINSGFKFKLASKFEGNDGKYKAGTYALSPSMDVVTIMDMIISGDSDENTTRFTIPEGVTIKEVAQILSDKNLINYDAFIDEIEHGDFDYDFVKDLPAGENRLEGYLYPETYEIYTNASEHDIINKMLAQYDKLVTDEHYKQAKAMGYSMYDIITIASIIEEETLYKAERPLVASVIYNRLNIGQKLQVCVSVQYALPEHKEELTYEDLEIESPYNTYKYAGLPPGPICSPSISSIEAALNPADTDYYYYVLSEKNDGSHNFSNSYSEFQQNKQNYKNSL